MAGNISTYDPSLPDIRPSEVGVEATATAAYRANRAFTELGSSIEQTGRQLGQDIGQGVKADVGAAYDMAVHKEVAHGSAAESGLINQANDAWNSIMTDPKTDPNDPNIAANFQQKVLQPMLDKFSNGFATEGGQDWAQRRTESIQQHFIASTSADMGNLAKAAVDKNIKMMSDSDTNTVMTNPARLPFLLNSAQDRINSILATSPNLKGAALAQAKETLPFDYQRGLVRSAAIGAIMQSGDPEGTAKAFGAKYPDLISGADLKVLSSQARTQLRMNNAAAKAQEVATKQLQQMDYDQKSTALAGSLIGPDGKLQTAGPDWFKQAKQLSLHPGAKPGTFDALMTFGEKHIEGANDKTDPAVEQKLADGISDGTTKQIDLIKASNDGTLSDKKFARLNANLTMINDMGEKGDGFKVSMDAVKDIVIDKSKVQDRIGASIYSNFFNTFGPAYAKRIAAGQDKPNDLDLRDANSFIRQSLQPYMPSLKDRAAMKEFLEANGPEAAQDDDWMTKAKRRAYDLYQSRMANQYNSNYK